MASTACVKRLFKRFNWVLALLAFTFAVILIGMWDPWRNALMKAAYGTNESSTTFTYFSTTTPAGSSTTTVFSNSSTTTDAPMPPTIASYRGDVASPPVKGENTDIVLFNRVPRCHNLLVLSLFHRIAEVNGINQQSDHDYHSFHLSRAKAGEWVNQLYSLQKPLLYDRHTYLVNFTNFGKPWPIHINLIRDPVQRYVTRYYIEANRCTNRELPGCNRIAFVRKYTIDQCVQHHLPFCTCRDTAGCRGIVPFFCGMSPKCDHSPIWALNRAKENIAKYYAVVGLTERMYEFLQVLQRILPKYFRGVSRLYLKRKREGTLHRYMDVSTPAPSNQTVAILKEKFKYDYYLYDFVKQHFYEKYKGLFPNQ